MAQSDHDALEHISRRSQMSEFAEDDVMKYSYLKRNFFTLAFEKLNLSSYV